MHSKKISIPTVAFLFLIVLFVRPGFSKPACISRQELTARGMGIVQKYYVSEGDLVKKGELIIEFDSRMLRAGLKEAQGATDAAKANVELALDALSRIEKLKGSEAVTDQQIAETRIRLAQARAVNRQAEGALERVKAQLEDASVRAEISGTVRGLPTILGAFVQVGQSLGRVEANTLSCDTPTLKN